MSLETTCYISITLTPDEVHLAASHAIIRRRAKLNGERKDREQGERSLWDNEVEGACAELAFCKLHKIYWSGVSKLRARDGGVEEVRWTRHHDVGGLIIYPNDLDDARLVLMDGHAPAYRIVGWLYARDGKRAEYLTEAGYFLVPRRVLRPYMEG